MKINIIPKRIDNELSDKCRENEGCLLLMSRNAYRRIFRYSSGDVLRDVEGRILFGEGLPTARSLEGLARRHVIDDATEICAVGGGSIIDSGKIVRLLLEGSLERVDLVSAVQAKGRTRRPIKLTAVTTLAGSGAEATPFAAIWPDVENASKWSLEMDGMEPEECWYSLEQIRTVDRNVGLASAIDCLSHLCESMWNKRVGVYTREELLLMCLDMSQIVTQIIEGRRYDEEKACVLSYKGGRAISRTKTGLSHAISYELTSRYGVPHGISVGISLNEVLRLNHGFMHEFGEVNLKKLEARLRYISGVCISEAGMYLSPNDFDVATLVEKTMASERSRNNLRDVSVEDVARIIERVRDSI